MSGLLAGVLYTPAVLGVVLLLIPLAFALSAAATWLVLIAAGRARVFDTAAAYGQAKEVRRSIPNIGGVAVFLSIAGPMAAGLIAAFIIEPTTIPALAAHLDGVRAQAPEAAVVIAGLGALHVLGLVDDRRPLGPVLKLGVMLAASLAVILLTDTRLLTALDAHAGGPWLSVVVTVVWFLAVTNALNFIDNMDGLSAGVSMVAAACFLIAALVAGEWFVAAVLALVVGTCAGFLVWNRPPARIFMGDGGSLVLGFLLAFLTARTTYFGQTPTGEPLAGGWYGVFMPLLVLAMPLYDFVSVTIMRLRQGRSPMVGDLQHLSHRLVKRGLSKPASVAAIWTLTLVTGIGGIVIGRLPGWGAALIAAQTLLLLALIAGLELATSPAGARRDSLEVPRDG